MRSPNLLYRPRRSKPWPEITCLIKTAPGAANP